MTEKLPEMASSHPAMLLPLYAYSLPYHNSSELSDAAREETVDCTCVGVWELAAVMPEVSWKCLGNVLETSRDGIMSSLRFLYPGFKRS